MPADNYILTLSCEDRPGIVAAVANLLFHAGANILESQQFDDMENGRFFMRVGFVRSGSEGALRSELKKTAAQFDMDWQLRNAAQPHRVLIMVSKFDHCLGDLLYRQRIGELNMDIAAIVSNHPLEVHGTPLIGDLPFFHLPITKETKAEQEAQVRRVIAETQAELVVLARYMQVLSDEMAAHLTGRCINIHHSFLPGFKGAKPYHQAYSRGVKMIGATAHYVTADLDEGPIIVQDVAPVNHADRPADLVRKGRDIERRVLAAAVRCHLEQRILLNGSTTVVFDS